MSKVENIGILGYGSYFPEFRIKTSEIADVWDKDPDSVKALAEEITVDNLDEDSITIAVQAALNALNRASNVDPEKIGSVYVGSESPPYAVKPSATIVSTAIGATNAVGEPQEVRMADYEFACKAGTEALTTTISQVAGDLIDYGLAIGADTSQAEPSDILEYTASSGGTAFIVGERSEDTLAYFEGQLSVGSDTPDFWRKDSVRYPKHGGRFTGKPAYFRHVMAAAEKLMDELDLSTEDFDYAAFHQPNGRFPLKVGSALGFDREKVEPSVITPKTGNFYSGASITGLSRVLDKADPGDRILMVSFGSGAGSDAFSLIAEEPINEKQELAPTVDYYLDRKKYVDYGTYSKLRERLDTLD